MVKRVFLSLGAWALLSSPALTQTYGDHLDLYFGDWHTGPVHTAYGPLREQDILTRGDALHPPAKGAVLRFASAYEHALLPARVSTSHIRLSGQQQVYFITSGEGTASSANQTVALSPNIAVLMPADLEFTITNTGDQPLTMYIIQEPTSPGFHPNTSMLARNENQLPFITTDLQWSYMVKKIFVASDGLATLDNVSTISLDALTVGRPQVTESSDVESVWTALKGTGIAFVSNQLRRQTPGTAFLEVPDGKTPHSIVNPYEDSEVKFLYFAHKPSPAAHAQHPN
jgi:mannose-6-phosphate isomerase-like protein (cupin superfamily)